MRTVRSFIALPLDGAILSRIERVYRKLASLPADVRWVRPESIHLTLKFLGSVGQDRIEDVGLAVQRGLSGFKPWTVAVRRVGTFPTMRHPKVVWLGLEDPTGQLVSMQQKIDTELSHLGFEKERRKFTPHLTLGRVRSSRGKKELISYLIDEREREVGELQVQRVILFKSDLKPSGAVHTALKEFAL